MVQALLSLIALAILVAGSPIRIEERDGCVTKYPTLEGETCESIGWSFGLTADQIWQANQFLDCNDIWKNTLVCIPFIGTLSHDWNQPAPTSATQSCVTRYPTLEGETCESIGWSFGLTADQIWQSNKFLDCNDIWKNTLVCIPFIGTLSHDWSHPAPTSATQTCVTRYPTLEGETCESIGWSFGLTADQIWQANKFLDCNDIWKSTLVCIPFIGTLSHDWSQPAPTTATETCVTRYPTLKGETCESIGWSFGLTADQIWQANQFLDCNDIWENTRVCIPFIGTLSHDWNQPAPTTATQTCVTRYPTLEGETCESIGWTFGLTADQIWQANKFLDCNNIWKNTLVCVPFIGTLSHDWNPPAPTTTTQSCFDHYPTLAGETCESIGWSFGLTADQIWQANKFLDCNDIWKGTRVCIPFLGTLSHDWTIPTSTSN